MENMMEIGRYFLGKWECRSEDNLFFILLILKRLASLIPIVFLIFPIFFFSSYTYAFQGIQKGISDEGKKENHKSENQEAENQKIANQKLVNQDAKIKYDRKNIFPNDIPELEELINLALQNNPEIKSVRENQKSFRYAGLYSSFLPPPSVGIGIGLKTGTFPEAHISQKIPFPSKLSMQKDVFSRYSDMWHWVVKSTENRVVSELKKSFFNIWFLESQKKVLLNMKDILEGIYESAEIRYRVGQETLQAPLRAQVEISKIEEKLILLRAEIEEAKSKIFSLIGKDVEIITPSSDISPFYIGLSADELSDLAINYSPHIKIAEKDFDAKKTQLELSKASYYPDFQIEFDTMGGMNRILFSVDLPIFFWRDQENRVREAKQVLISSLQNFENEKLKILSNIRTLREFVNSTFELVKLYEDKILPSSRASFESARASWMVGKTEFTAVLDTFLVLLMYEVENLNQKRLNRKYLAELESMIFPLGDNAKISGTYTKDEKKGGE